MHGGSASLATRDKLLLGTLLPLWLVFFCAMFRAVWVEAPYSPARLQFSTSSDDYPVVLSVVPWLQATSALRDGDRLLRAGDSDLRGVGQIGLEQLLPAVTGRSHSVDVSFERTGKRQAAALRLGSVRDFWWKLPTSFVFAVTGLLLLVRGTPAPLVRLCFVASVLMGINLVTLFPEPRALSYVGLASHLLSISLIPPLLIQGMRSFSDASPHRGVAAAWPWLLSLIGPVELLWLIGVPGAELAALATTGAVASALLVVAIATYRRADAEARRQVRWVYFGFYCGLLPLILAASAAAYRPELLWGVNLGLGASAIIPICILIAIARYNLFDIDRLISATIAWNVVLVLLVSTGFAVIPRASECLGAQLGLEDFPAQALLALLLTAVFVPAQRRLRPLVERWLFPERYAMDRGMVELLTSLPSTEEISELLVRVAESLCRMARPDACVVYAQSATGYAPVFARAIVAPPAFERGSALVAALRAQYRVLALESDGGRRRDELDPFGRAALETLAASVVLPIRRGEDLVAFFCLGRKRSGDIYTRIDLQLLHTLASKLSAELQRIEQSEILEQGNRMREALQSYVPGAVVAEMRDGRHSALEPSEKEISVLFVDLRGFTSYSEARKPQEIFSTVNRYTEVVSEIIRASGGSVVEFAGDGMMAVFGAPGALSEKERSAVKAAKSICTAVADLGHDGGAPLSVGVGVATGPAFVGNVRAADRVIWTAIGNTVNLAARLQSLTRELGAATIVDSTTWWRLDAAARDTFRRRDGVKIRGRSQAEDIYLQPLAESQAIPSSKTDERISSGLRVLR